MTRRERLEGKLERRLDWAEKADHRSEQRLEATRKIADGIPLGQPILVGHHSERHARRDIERIDNGMRKGIELAKLAQHHRGRASGLEHQLENSVFSDDADAIEQLEARIAENEKEAQLHGAINKAWRKSKGDVTALVASGLVSEKLAKTITDTMRVCPYLDKPLSTTSARAAIRRDKARIEEIKRRQAQTARAEAAGGVVVENLTMTPSFSQTIYCRVTFAEKPEQATIDALKAAGFSWGGGSWVGDREKLPEGIRGHHEV